ncbi:MAG: anion permease [Pirellulaceae bacterium]
MVSTNPDGTLSRVPLLATRPCGFGGFADAAYHSVRRCRLPRRPFGLGHGPTHTVGYCFCLRRTRVGERLRGIEAEQRIGESLAGIASRAPSLLVIVGICLMVTFLTEITSGTATTSLLLPILAGTAVAADLVFAGNDHDSRHDRASAFMLPVATAPNTIVYGAGGITTGTMARNGFVLNFIAATVISLVCWWLLG